MPSPPMPDRGGRLHRLLRYRITGRGAQDRMRPLLTATEEAWGVEWVEVPEDEDDKDEASINAPLDFVWETQRPRKWKAQHGRARVRNSLANSRILEDKGNFALLQGRMPPTVPTLETHVLSAPEVGLWMAARGWSGNHSDDGSDWWVLKPRGGNGGVDVHLLNPRTAAAVRREVERRMPSETFVVQRYVARPLLHQGRKFHLRVYALLRIGPGGDDGGGHSLQPWLSRRAFRLAASEPYSLAQDGENVHLTNMSVNRTTSGYAGQEPVDLPTEYAGAWPGIQAAWRAAAAAAAPFMGMQASSLWFDFFGLDFLLAEDGRGCWLLEANRLPGLRSSAQNFEAEERVFNGMMGELLRRCVLGPLTGQPPGESSTSGDGDCVWVPVTDSEDEAALALQEVGPEAPLHHNVLSFGLYARRQLCGL